jgi:translation initiation factor IF-2
MMGGAGLEEPERAETREGPEDPEDAARVRGPAWPAAAERPAPRDQPAADPAAPAAPEVPDDPAGPLPDLDGRSSGGATRLPLAASGMFGLRALPAALTPLTTRRPPVLVSPSPSAGGGASGRNREAYASLDALATVPARAAVSPEAGVPAATPAPAPAATPAASAAAWPGLRRAHRAARTPATAGTATVAASSVDRRKVEPASRRLYSARSAEPMVP